MLNLPSALSKITTRLFMNDCCLLLPQTLPVSLSLKRSLICVRRFRPNSWTHGIHVFWGTIGTLGRRAESGVRSASFLRVGVLVSACTFPRPSIVVDQSSTDPEKSSDFVPTSGFTFGDNVTHFCDSFQCSRMLRTVEHLSLLVSSNLFLHGSGRVHVDFVTCAH